MSYRFSSIFSAIIITNRCVGRLPRTGGLALTYSLENKDASADKHNAGSISPAPSSAKVYELVDDAQLLYPLH